MTGNVPDLLSGSGLGPGHQLSGYPSAVLRFNSLGLGPVTDLGAFRLLTDELRLPGTGCRALPPGRRALFM